MPESISHSIEVIGFREPVCGRTDLPLGFIDIHGLVPQARIARLRYLLSRRRGSRTHMYLALSQPQFSADNGPSGLR